MAVEDIAPPSCFCWTKFGTEAGDTIDVIRARKESERQAGGGLFYWGIGNSIAPSIQALVETASNPEVLFTPMLSKPAVGDVAPERVVSWRSGLGIDGRPYSLRSGVVTSKASAASSPKRHYALVCYSVDPLDVDGFPVNFAAESVVNLRSGAPVGSSQVTSVVRYVDDAPAARRRYTVAFRATLVAPYFVTLLDAGTAVQGTKVSADYEQELLWA
ncbi:hypothetical protein [Cellulomonas sp. NS3]|uniref:hypothetical protein n=1 Tax=Cellulomonas sp. NS3 TaxID=2973977 RepID=UPI002161AAF6|nr:hypothetical protein [Cellulomonas sp. NS3]